jgi:maltooligosyltrehalose trehalohydrolase
VGPSFALDGSTTFRLWAPSQAQVSLEIGSETIPMSRSKEGWFQCGIDRQPLIPDPASRYQPSGVDAPSVLLDENSYRWQNLRWTGRPWEEAVIYELHLGTFTQEGTFRSAIPHLRRLAEIGFTAIELMPLAEFPGERGWGYDGVYQYAPHHAYGSPDDFKALVDAAHRHGMMVILDVVYNHFGPGAGSGSAVLCR